MYSRSHTDGGYRSRAREEPFIDRFFTSLKGDHDGETRRYLQSVYASTAMAVLASGVGAYLGMTGKFMAGSLAGVFIAMLCSLAIFWTQPTKDSQRWRLGLLLAAAFFAGHGLWPTLTLSVAIDPSIIISALMGTGVIFLCFTLAALTSPRGSYLYLGVTLMNISFMCLIALLLQSFTGLLGTWVYSIYPYIGLAVACGFIMYDTQIIIERCHWRDKDVVRDAVMVFFDLFDVFQLLLRILQQQKAEENRKRR